MERGINRRQSDGDWQLVAVPVWLSPAPNYHHLSWPGIKLIPALFLARVHAADLLVTASLASLQAGQEA